VDARDGWWDGAQWGAGAPARPYGAETEGLAVASLVGLLGVLLAVSASPA
jgi:hypothetical protein